MKYIKDNLDNLDFIEVSSGKRYTLKLETRFPESINVFDKNKLMILPLISVVLQNFADGRWKPVEKLESTYEIY